MATLDDLELTKPQRSLFWFTTDERFSLEEPERILFSRIWQTLTLPAKVSLARPENEVVQS